MADTANPYADPTNDGSNPYEDPNNDGSSGLIRRVAGDSAVSLAKGVVDVGQTAYQLADAASHGALDEASTKATGAIANLATRIGDAVIGNKVGTTSLPEFFGDKGAAKGPQVDMGGERLSAGFNQTGQALQEQYSPETQAAFEKVNAAKGFIPTAIEAIKNPSTIVQGAIESLPVSLGMMGAVRTVAMRAGTKAAAEAAAKGLSVAEQQAAAETAIGKFATGKAGVGTQMATDFATSGAQQGGQAKDAVLGLPEADLAKSAAYQQLRKTMTPEQARNSLANDAQLQGFVVAGVLSAATSPISAAVEGRAATAGLKKNLAEDATRKYLGIPSLAKSVGTEFAQEGLQSAGEQVGTNAGLRVVDPNADLTKGVGNAAATGALAGALMGGAFHVAGHAGTDKINADGTVNTASGHAIDPNAGPISRAAAASVLSGLESINLANESARASMSDDDIVAQMRASADADLRAQRIYRPGTVDSALISSAVAPAGQRTPFASPDEVTRAAFARKASEVGLSEQQAAQLAPPAVRDSVTGFFDGRQDNAKADLVQRAIDHVRDTTEGAQFVSADLVNLGGLNTHVGDVASHANEHYRSMAQIVKRALQRTGGDVVPMRTGGDEFGFVVANANANGTRVAMKSAQAQIEKYAKANGLSDIPHPKRPGEVGVGVHLGSTDIRRGDSVSHVLEAADLDMARSKRNVSRKAAGTVGAQSTRAASPRAATGNQRAIENSRSDATRSADQRSNVRAEIAANTGSNDVISNAEVADAGIRSMALHAQAVQQSPAEGRTVLPRPGDQSSSGVGDELRGVSRTHRGKADALSLVGSDRNERALRAGERPLGNGNGSSAQPSLLPQGAISRTGDDRGRTSFVQSRPDADSLRSDQEGSSSRGSADRPEASLQDQPVADARRANLAAADVGKRTRNQSADAPRTIAQGDASRTSADAAIARDRQAHEAGSETRFAQPETPYDPTNGEDLDRRERTDNAARSRSAANASDRGRRPVLRYRALGIREDIERRGVAHLVGQSVRTAADVAELAQVYRDPRYETFRLLFIKDDEIVHASGVTARMPGEAPAFPSNFNFEQGVAWIKQQMQSSGAEQFYLLHNHPSGNPTPSKPDLKLTAQLTKAVPGMLGHVIINSGRYAVIDPSGAHRVEALANASEHDPLLTPSIPSMLLGKTIARADDVASIARGLKAQDGYVTLMGTTGDGGVRAIAEVPASIIKNNLRASAIVSRFARFSGSQDVFLHGENADFDPAIVRHLIERRLATDVVYTHGQSARTFINPDPRYTLGRREVSGHIVSQSHVEAGFDPAVALREITPAKMRDRVVDFFDSANKFNWWHRTVGTQFHKAKVDADFGRVFRLGQQFLEDTSRLAMDASDLAPDILPRLDSLKDIAKLGPSSADLRAVSNAVFEGTLTDQKIYSVGELRDRFKLNDKQIDLYKQSRAAIEKSLTDLAAAEMARLVRGDGLEAAVSEAKAAPERAADILIAALTAKASDLTRVGDEGGAARAMSTVADIRDQAERVDRLKQEGYAPLMRFGRETVYVVGQNGEQHYFGMFDRAFEANRMARQMRDLYPDAKVERGTLSTEAYKTFQGVSPDTLELFAKSLGARESAVFQQYLRMAVNNRSALKRLIARKGIAGFSEDVSRVLATFVTSNARSASKSYHFGDMLEATNAIPNVKGDVKDEAIRLVKYLQDPQEEAASIRGLLFVQFLGGSVASAFTNMTQPVLQTFPYLAQFGLGRAAFALRSSAAVAVGKLAGTPELQAAMTRATREGVVAPHELHQLYAESIQGLGSSLGVRKALRAWGSLFALSEGFNRRLTMAAAFQVAQSMGPEALSKVGFASAYDFAVNAVHETQGVYNRGNRPNWARGAVGATLFTFKQFTVSYLEFAKRLPPREKAIAFAMLVIAAGGQGLPFAEDIEDIIDTIGQSLGYDTNSKKALRDAAVKILGNGFGEFITNGLSTIPGVPIDVQGRLGLPDLVPGTAMFKRSNPDKSRDALEFAGPIGSVIQQSTTAFSKVQQGDIFGLRGALASLAPKALRDALQAMDMAQTGIYRDVKGRKVIDTDAADALSKALGFQPARVADQARRVSGAQENIQLVKTVESQIAEQWAQGIFEHDPAKVQSAVANLRGWNQKNPTSLIRVTPVQVHNLVHAMAIGQPTRVLKSAPKEIRGGVAEAMR